MSPSLNASATASRVVVFIDYQNVYKCARHAFADDDDIPGHFGQIHPMKLGYLLAARAVHGRPAPRCLAGVRIYRGRPDPRREPNSHAANMRQSAAWEQAGAVVKARPLRYPAEWPALKPEEKGIDVQIAVDMIMMATHRQLDVAVLFSADTDLRPVLEAYHELPSRDDDGPLVEVAAWTSSTARKQLTIEGRTIWCHRLDREAFEGLRDRRDYGIARRRVARSR